MRVFVTGGSGFVGGHVVERLVRDGHEVVALARSDAAVRAVEALGARAARGDLGAIPEGALQGVDAVVHCAARAEDWGKRAWFDEVNEQPERHRSRRPLAGPARGRRRSSVTCSSTLPPRERPGQLR
jgi:uncharacterized protein YbjT (DUF2867 family)